MHPFERAGLGKAPFRYAGIVHQEISHGQRVIGSVGGCEVTTRPGGTCDACGHAIVDIYRIVSADGKESNVGCDCVLKVAMKPSEHDRVKRDAKAAKQAKEDARIAAARDRLPEAHSLRSRPHPNASLNAEGQSLWHYAEWMLRNGGRSGKLMVARMIERETSHVIVD